jgi:glycosyltransferase involved in cell wall biosynthesis
MLLSTPLVAAPGVPPLEEASSAIATWGPTVALGFGAAFSLQAAILGIANLARYRSAATDARPAAPTSITVCIPARNEEANIEACVRSVLANAQRPDRLDDRPDDRPDASNPGRLSIEVLCYDDQSSDATPAILARLAAEDDRVRVAQTVPLPPGWNGKQHACWRLAGEARGTWLLFTDADVRFESDALRRSIAEAERLGVALLSTVPRQIVGSMAEALAVPMIHMLLLSYLPIGRMRTTADPAASAGCGQFLLASADAYRTTGGHSRFRDSMHDGIRMPRLFRAAGFRTDLFDGTDLVAVRMYRGLAQTWRGFAKNAFEGLGSVTLLVMLTLMHALGHVFPWAFLLWSLATARPADAATGLAVVAVAAAIVERWMLATRFRQPRWIAFLHPVAIVMMTAIQWHSLWLALRGRRSWKGRTAEASPTPA